MGSSCFKQVRGECRTDGSRSSSVDQQACQADRSYLLREQCPQRSKLRHRRSRRLSRSSLSQQHKQLPPSQRRREGAVAEEVKEAAVAEVQVAQLRLPLVNLPPSPLLLLSTSHSTSCFRS